MGGTQSHSTVVLPVETPHEAAGKSGRTGLEDTPPPNITFANQDGEGNEKPSLLAPEKHEIEKGPTSADTLLLREEGNGNGGAVIAATAAIVDTTASSARKCELLNPSVETMHEPISRVRRSDKSILVSTIVAAPAIPEQATGAAATAHATEHKNRQISSEPSGGGRRSSAGTSVLVSRAPVQQSVDDPVDGMSDSQFVESWARRSMCAGGNKRKSVTAAAACFGPDAWKHKEVLDWNPDDVLFWLSSDPKIKPFILAPAFAGRQVDGRKLSELTMSDLKDPVFHYPGFRGKTPTVLWVELKRKQPQGSKQNSSARFSCGQSIEDEAAHNVLCTVEEFVGRGAFGEVYAVRWKGVGRDRAKIFAMKTVRFKDIDEDKRDEYRILLVEEILTAARVKPHPNVIAVAHAHIMGFCTDAEEYFCFEDFVRGRNLEQLVRGGLGDLYKGELPLALGRLLTYSLQISRGLNHIHRCGVIHQDLKSANIMVSESENTATITDFGFAALGEFISTGKEDGTPTSPTHFGVEDALAAGGVTLQARMKGFTPKYRCPEIRDLLQSQVLNSMVTHKSDMWAFGVLLMELFAGGTQGLRSGRGEDAPLLLDLLIRNSMSGEPISEHARNNASFRIIPPESIIALLRDLFQVDPAARPPSMSSVTKRLSLSLQEAVEGHAAVIPEGSNVQDLLGPPGGVELDTQPDYSKVGRLHMWLGKALFFKGGDKREQAISEYRQGVEVLEKSPADRNSSSMALFRWYLGSALLESLRDKQQQSSASNTMVGKGGASSDYSTFSSGLSALDVDSSVLSQSEPTLEEQQDHRLAMEALQHLRVAVGISPDHPKYRFGLALACKATGDVEEAIRQLEIAVSNESSSEAKAECLYQLGLLHRDCLDPRRACEYLKEAVKLDKSGSTHYTEALEAVSGRSYRNRRASTGEAAERPRFKVGDVVCGHKIESIDNIGSTPPWFQGGGGRVSTYRVSSCLRSGYGGSEPASLCCIQFNDVLTTSRTAVDRPSTSSSVGSFGNITYQGSYTGGRRPMSVSSATSGKSSRAPSRYDHHYAEVLLAAAKGALLGPTNAYVMSVQMLSSGPGPNELTIVTDVLQRSRSTLQQVLEGPLYSGTAAVAVERMLRLSSQIAAGIAHCHNRGIILQDIKPHDIMVSPSWDAKLRPDLAHARFDQRWLKRCQAKGSAHAGITRERRRLPSMSSQPRGASDAKAPSVETPNSSHRTADDEDLEEQADNGSNLDLSVVQAEFSSVRMDYQSPEIAAHVMHRTQAGAHWQGSRRPFYVRPATSDIWVWALITLQMFADQIWGVGRGEEGRSALDHLVQRHTGVESWTTAEVLQWLATISGMEGPEVAREITAFKITGKQLLIPSRGRDIMEKLGLFISRGDLAELLWEALTTQVQRWPVPAGLVDILRKCLAQNASDRFQHMSDVCDSLQQALGIERRRSSEVTPTGKGPALEAKEQAAEVISRAASCLKSQDQIEKAEEHYLLSLHVCPTHIEAHVGLGAVYSHPHFESHDAACASYMRAAELMGSSDPRYRRIMAAAKDAERKSNFYQSAAVMSQLSGRYRPEALRRHSSMASSVSSLSTEDNGVWRPVGKSSSNSTVSGQVLGYGLEIGRHRGTV